MFAKRPLLAFALAALVAVSYSQTVNPSVVIDNVNGLLSGSFAPANGTVSWITNAGYRLSMPGLNSYLSIHLPTTSWAGYSHVDVRIKNEGTKAASLEMDCWSRNGQGWLSSGVVVGPGETLDVSMPLKPTAWNGLRAHPSITDSARFQTVSAGSIYPTEVGGFYFFNKDNCPANIVIQSMSLANHTVSAGAMVDVYGQQAKLSWAGRVASDEELATAARAETIGAALPYAADDFGGVVGGKNFGPSNAFRRVKDGDRWYLVTPNGNRFFSFGVNEVGAQAWTPTSGREGSFTGLSTLQSKYPDAWSVRDGQNGFVPYQVNLAKKYGSTWRNTAEDLFTKRLRAWGFNSLGTNSWDTMVADGKLVSTFSSDIVGPHARFETYDGRTIHDVFAQQFATDVLNTCRTRIAQTGASNSHNLGVFVDNELPWGNKETSDDRYRYGLAYGALRSVTTYSHSALVTMLLSKYTTIAKLNAAWNTSYSGWGDLNKAGVDAPAVATPEMRADFAQYGGLFAAKYFSTIKTQLSKLGFKGLYLGCRFASFEVLPEVTAAAAANCDVISVNVYNANPSLLAGELKNVDCPVLISEFCFGASDQGRVGMPLYPSMTENARVDAYRRFMDDVKTWPNIVGIHWYRWEDFPATGKIDGDNMSEGLLSIVDNPYTALTKQTTLSTVDYMSFLRSQP